MGVVSVTTISSETETITKDKLNGLAGNLVSEFNGEIDDANIDSLAAIAATKLNLSTIAQSIDFTGTLDFSGATVTAQWTAASLIVTTVDINGGAIDGTTLGAASACTATDIDINGGNLAGVTVDGSLTWSAAQNLNSQALTNVNIDSGDVTGVTVDGTANQGDVWYDNGTKITRLTPGTAGQFLQTKGAAANPVWAGAGQIETFTSSSIFTVPAGVTLVWVTACGGGGGGDNNGSSGDGAGGGGGATIIDKAFTVTPAAKLTVTVGGGGAGGAYNGGSGGNGLVGDDSVFDTFTIPGGASGSTGGAGGAGSINGSLTTGGTGIFDGGDGAADGGTDKGGGGGASYLGTGGRGATLGGADPTAGTYGGGGGGAARADGQAAGAGGDGIVIVKWV